MDLSAISQCASHSIGPANQLFGLLIQAILATQCSISPPNLWPEDYGEKFVEKSMDFAIFISIYCTHVIKKYRKKLIGSFQF